MGDRKLNIIIPTYGRLGTQKTYESLPEKYQKQVHFVVRPEEYAAFQARYSDCVIRCLPSTVKNFAQTKEWILNHYRSEKVWILDDGFTKFHAIRRNTNGENPRWIRIPLLEPQFDELIDRITKLLDEYIHGAVQLDYVSPPTGKAEDTNSRLMTNLFADFSKWPEDVSFVANYDACLTAEDFYVNLWLLSRGFANVVITDIGVYKKMREPGGCNTYRTVENHNRSCEALHAAFPNFTRLRKKKPNRGPWSGKEVYAVTCYWKKAFRSSCTSSSDKTQ